MSRCRLAVLLLMFGPMSLAQTAPATQPAAPAPGELLDRLQRDLMKVSTVQSDFVQTKQLAMLKHDLVIHGRFALEKPEHLAWLTDTPNKSAITLKGDEVRQWDEVTDKVQTTHLGGDATFKTISDQLQSWFTGNYKGLENEYDISLVSQTPLTLRFAPREKSTMTQFIKAVQVTFDQASGYIQRIQIDEKSGSHTDLQFVNAKVNQPIPATMWEVPPHGQK